jgi:hypothetical protein
VLRIQVFQPNEQISRNQHFDQSSKINLLSLPCRHGMGYLHYLYYASKIGWTGGPCIPWNGAAIGSFLSRVRHQGVLESERVPERCHTSGAAVDVCSDAPAGAQRAERAADGGIVDVLRALSGSSCAPCMMAQRVARCDPYNIRNCLPPKT